MRPPPSKSSKIRSANYDLPVPPSLLIRRGNSGIHGSGVYARIAIPSTHVIIEYRGERITKAESDRREEARLQRIRRGHDSCTYIFHLNARHDLDARRGGNISRFINHSCQPNCHSELKRGRIWIVAIKDIEPGEEITFDYGFAFRDRADNPCRCGSAQCVGYIVAENQRWRLRRLKRAST
jgi:SET domain-containing protein